MSFRRHLYGFQLEMYNNLILVLLTPLQANKIFLKTAIPIAPKKDFSSEGFQDKVLNQYMNSLVEGGLQKLVWILIFI